MAKPWRGVFTIPCTPFTETDTLDIDSLQSEIAFCLEAGAHGIVAPVNASEFWTLSDEERKTVAQVIVEAVGGRVPTVIGVTGASSSIAVEFARHAQQIGADAVIALPPHARAVPVEAIFAYYQALSQAISIPIFVQNHDAPAGTRMSPAFVARLVRELEYVDWIKEETFPPGHAIQEEIELAGPKLQGVMGGVAGRYIFDEYRRGACGIMPACEATDIHVQIWNALDSGNERQARALFACLLPLLNYEALLPGVYKAVLKRRGIIATDHLRGQVQSPLDARDHEELSAIFADLQSLFTLSAPV